MKDLVGVVAEERGAGSCHFCDLQESCFVKRRKVP